VHRASCALSLDPVNTRWESYFVHNAIAHEIIHRGFAGGLAAIALMRERKLNEPIRQGKINEPKTVSGLSR
jgi:hypothetical protein